MCAILGLIDVRRSFTAKDRVHIMRNLATVSECRGTDATGFAYNHRGYLNIVKRPVCAHRMKLRLPDDARAIVGHTRMTTQGKAQLNDNNHPFMGKVGDTRFALVHNGILYNDEILRETQRLPRTKIETDSYIATQLIEQHGSLDFDSLRYMAEQVSGTFTFAILDSNDNTWIVKGDNPVCIYRSVDYGFYIYASTKEILTTALDSMGKLGDLRYEEIELAAGEMLKISVDGKMSRGAFQMELQTFHRRFNWNGYDWQELRSHQPMEASGYLDELKCVASCYGYSSDEIDELFAEGFTCDEIEEMLFSVDYDDAFAGCSQNER